jgi:hypothetical protein
MMRQILITEPNSNLKATCSLLDDSAPISAEFLWQLAQTRLSFEASHAIWTGPELSCPLPASVLPEELARMDVPLENATSFPEPGEIVLASVPAGTIKGVPPGNFFDIGIFYGPGGRLLMPFGWIKGTVCARIANADLEHVQSSIHSIRRNGVCKLSIRPAE